MLAEMIIVMRGVGILQIGKGDLIIIIIALSLELMGLVASNSPCPPHLCPVSSWELPPETSLLGYIGFHRLPRHVPLSTQ